MAKQDKFIIKTPVVELAWPYLRQPDTQFDAIGHYKCDFLMTPEQANDFVQKIFEDPRSISKGKPSKPKGTKSEDKIKFRTKQKAKISYQKDGQTIETDMAPKLYYIVDGKTLPYPDDSPSPYSGSTGELEIEVAPFDGFGGGVTLRLRSVRLHDVVSSSGGSGGGWDDVSEDAVEESSETEGAW